MKHLIGYILFGVFALGSAASLIVVDNWAAGERAECVLNYQRPVQVSLTRIECVDTLVEDENGNPVIERELMERLSKEK